MTIYINCKKKGFQRPKIICITGSCGYTSCDKFKKMPPPIPDPIDDVIPGSALELCLDIRNQERKREEKRFKSYTKKRRKYVHKNS